MQSTLTQGTSYDEVKPGKPPIAIQVAPKPSQARLDLHPMNRAASSSSPELDHTAHAPHSRLQEQEQRRDSGLGTAASKRASRATTVGTDKTDAESTTSGKFRAVKKSPSLPRIEGGTESPTKSRGFARIRMVTSATGTSHEPSAPGSIPQLSNNLETAPLEMPIFSLEDLSTPDAVQFSKRGSLLVKGRRPSTSRSDIAMALQSPDSPAPIAESTVAGPPMPSTTSQSSSRLVVPQKESRPRDATPSSTSRVSMVPSRALSMDEENLSRRILSMYETGDTTAIYLSSGELLSQSKSAIAEDHESGMDVRKPAQQTTPERRRSSLLPERLSGVHAREDGEVAGGLEDFQNLKSDEVDRYGFIIKKPPPIIATGSPGGSYVSLKSTMTAPEGMGISRMATQLRLAADTPRRSRSFRSKLGRSSSINGSTRSVSALEQPGRQSPTSNRASRFLRPTSSQASYRTTTTVGSSRLRRAGNHLPHNKDRKCVDEAGDMLTLPPGLADIAESEAQSGKNAGKSPQSIRSKEREREEKWRKMARIVKPANAPGSGSSGGGGMHFTFDSASPKVISRTWKGIPDRWRASAWWSFLETSARKQPDHVASEELIRIFYELAEQSCADDVQIDLDVPRTIGGHVMFRKRYRGGQRLLFRVLHALSLYFPDPGYVQGMAALAATFLCYFEEERAFVMLVRMWELRGLARLYKAGFEGLMGALGEFEVNWLAGGIVGAKLKELGIPPTSYGTRWYLTVFNYSIPFAAQLRVWDVFLLLGDPKQATHGPGRLIKHGGAQRAIATDEKKASDDGPAGFDGCLDVLHATSAALIDGTRDILLDSDFDNAMKTLTSWIPIRDEELLMRVAKVEYKYHRSRR